MVKREPIPGSLVKARMVKGKQPYDLWAIILEHDRENKTVRASVVEVVPADYDEWTKKGIEPPPSGKEVIIPKGQIEVIIHPRRRLTKQSSPQFVLKLNNGKISDIYAVGDHVAMVRLVDLAKHYGDGESRHDFHRDVLVTRKGVEGLEDGLSIG